jgi:hypothetical protein
MRLVQGPKVAGMLAQRRSINFRGDEIERTPFLIPSFSSKGFPEIKKTLEYAADLIDGPALVSAYDLHYEQIKPPFHFPSLIFLDSGGYEASKETELSDFGERDHRPREWTQEMHETQLKKWKSKIPTVAISFDHPGVRMPVMDQVARAKAMAAGRKDILREILLKPETSSRTLLHMPSIIENIHALADFDVIGVTEKEVGNSILDRMRHIAELRRALGRVGLNTPIHVFGSLDTVTTPMYFLAGADIFDGLTWLRFAFHEGQTLYKHNYGALKFGVAIKAHVVDGRCWNDNYYYMKSMELEMQRFLQSRDFRAFKFHSAMFQNAYQNVLESMGE